VTDGNVDGAAFPLALGLARLFVDSVRNSIAFLFTVWIALL